MPSELETQLQLHALDERERFLEKRLREMERILWEFLARASGKPNARLPGYALAVDDEESWDEARRIGSRILEELRRKRP